MDAQKNQRQPEKRQPTVPQRFPPAIGSLFAGIGGFDLGFEQAGFKTAWQVEIADFPHEVLRDRFPHAKQLRDVQTCLPELWPVDVIVGGFPCQDVSAMGKRAGLAGKRTGLFFDTMHIVSTLKPRWLVLENVPGLLSSNNGRDFEVVLETLAQCGYVGFWRVLDARYFGVASRRRRIFILAGLGEQPPLEFMADTGPMERVSGKAEAGSPWADAHATLLAGFPQSQSIDISGSNIAVVRNRRREMAERQRKAEADGFCLGLGAADLAAAHAAGNAVCPPVARWIAQKLIKTF